MDTTKSNLPKYLLDEMWYGTQLHVEVKEHCPLMDVMSSVDALHTMSNELNLFVLASKLGRIFITQSELYMVYYRTEPANTNVNAGLIVVQGIGNKSKSAQAKIGLKLLKHLEANPVAEGQCKIFKKIEENNGKLRWTLVDPTEEDFVRAEKKASTRKNLVKLGHVLQEAIAPPTVKYTLYVANLAFDTTEKSLSEFFSRFKVDKVTITKDKNTGRSKGYGFVCIQTSESAQRVVTMMNGRILDGREIKVQRAHAPTRKGGVITPGTNNNNNNDDSTTPQ